MGYEIDFLNVGEESKSGDAIALRYGDLFGNRESQTVVVIDGGFTESGKRLAEHIRHYYGTDQVDLVVSTHPDQDHVNGLEVVLNEMQVRELWMHRPWLHSEAMASAKRYDYQTLALTESLRKSLQEASDLEALAVDLGIPIKEPFQGLMTGDGKLVVLGPTEAYYEELLGEIRSASDLSAKHAAEAIRRKVGEFLNKVVPETLWLETLTDFGETSPQNNSSAICLLQVEGRYCVLTSDAGMPALDFAADYLNDIGLFARDLTFVQVPHHGSRRNVGPSILDRLLGPKGQTGIGSSFVSSAAGSNKHPAKKVTNAFLRRGYPVVATNGETIGHSFNAPPRPGWGTAQPLPLYYEVEDDEG